MQPEQFFLHGQWSRSIAGAPLDTVAVPGGYPPVGECELAYDFPNPWPAKASQRVFLCTDGVLGSAEFLLNGNSLGQAGPWIGYRFEIPVNALQGTNRLAAKVRDLPESFGQALGRRWDAGMARKIWIERRPPTFLERFHFGSRLDERGNAQITVKAELNGPSAGGKLTVLLQERGTQRTVATANGAAGAVVAFQLERPQLWSPDSPFCYTATVTYTAPDGAADQLSDIVGFRTIEIKGQDFFLNGKRLVLRGICRHEFTSAHGYSPPEEAIRHDLAQIKKVGFNYIRLVHAPQSPAVPRIAAEFGILVTEEPGTCFHDLANEAVVAPAVECLRRTVLRDRNLPNIFAWLIYNECNPNSAYAVRIAKMVREIDPHCRLSMADCSSQVENIKAMVAAADLDYMGINVYDFWPHTYHNAIKPYTEKPLVFTEWGGWPCNGNPRTLKMLCDNFVFRANPGQSPRIAGCTFWAWADYEERSRGADAAVDGWTIEGLLDQQGRPKPVEITLLAELCAGLDAPKAPETASAQILGEVAVRPGRWTQVALQHVKSNQHALESQIINHRHAHQTEALMPTLGKRQIHGIPFECRDSGLPRAFPLLLGLGNEEIVIPVGQTARQVAVLGHVTMLGGYPFWGIFNKSDSSTTHPKPLGALASLYRFIFDDGEEVAELKHGINLLRSNNINRYWLTTPRSPETRPAVQIPLSESFEIMRIDLWEKDFARPRWLKEIRWKLVDQDSIQALFAVSVEG